MQSYAEKQNKQKSMIKKHCKKITTKAQSTSKIHSTEIHAQKIKRTTNQKFK